MKVYLRALGVVAPGLAGWSQAATVLRGEAPYRPEPLPRYQPAMLPPNERRRTTATIKLALQAASEAMTGNGEKSPAAVFASADGDLEIADRLCSALALPGRPVSPTHFHNSVHNAPAGYWSIGSGSNGASTSLSTWHGSFAAGLLEAASTCVVEQCPTLLVAYDHPAPPPLDRFCPTQAPFAVALVLTAEPSADAMSRLRIATTRNEETRLSGDLEGLRQGNPAARALPLLSAIACGDSRTVTLPYLDDLMVEVQCAL